MRTQRLRRWRTKACLQSTTVSAMMANICATLDIAVPSFASAHSAYPVPKMRSGMERPAGPARPAACQALTMQSAFPASLARRAGLVSAILAWTARSAQWTGAATVCRVHRPQCPPPTHLRARATPGTTIERVMASSHAQTMTTARMHSTQTPYTACRVMKSGRIRLVSSAHRALTAPPPRSRCEEALQSYKVGVRRVAETARWSDAARKLPAWRTARSTNLAA